MMSEKAGSAIEGGELPSWYPADNLYGRAMGIIYGSLGASKADVIFLQSQWMEYISSDIFSIVANTAGTTASDSPWAWMVFRAAESKAIDSGGSPYMSGWPGNFSHCDSGL
jgi:hypothetical protein